MDVGATMKTLESLGSEKTRTTYRRHGAAEPLFGVLFGELIKLRKQIKTDHVLARELWKTGNHDARLLACMVADPAKATREELSTWAAELRDSGTAEALATFAARTPLADALGVEWRRTPTMARAGWSLLGHRLAAGAPISEKEARDRVAEIEKGIHGAENWTRRTMMYALIGLGATTPALRKEAEAAIRRIGPVAFDPGETACEFPDPLPYIATMWARKQAKGSRPPGKSSPRTAAAVDSTKRRTSRKA